MIDCDDSYTDDDGQTFCRSCYEERTSEDSALIRGHDYKPRAVFFQTDKEKVSSRQLYFGLEIETENVKERYGLDESIRAVGLDDNPAWYCKSDGSLSNGFEMVSHPGTYKYWMEKADLGFLGKLQKRGFRSYDPSTCGLHVHVSRSALSAMDICKLLRFFKDNAEFLIKLSRRRTGPLAQWTKIYGYHVDRNYGKRDVERVISRKAMGSGDGDRYQAINLNPSRTVEFRLFRGTLKAESVRDVISFLYTLIQYVKCTSLADLSEASYRAWIGKEGNKYIGKDARKSLVDYINARVEDTICA